MNQENLTKITLPLNSWYFMHVFFATFIEVHIISNNFVLHLNLTAVIFFNNANC